MRRLFATQPEPVGLAPQRTLKPLSSPSSHPHPSRALHDPQAPLLAATLLAASLAARQRPGISPSTADAGDSIVIGVTGAGFTDRVIGGSFSLSFDASVLALQSVVIDTVTWGSSARWPDRQRQRRLSDVYFNNIKAALPTGDFSIARLNFTARPMAPAPSA